MADILTSIHGKKLGLDSVGNLIVQGGVINQGDGASAVHAASTATNIPASGLTTISTAVVGYILADPIPGVRKTIVAPLPSTAATRFVQTSTANGVTFASTGAFNKWGSTASQSLELIGISTLQYAVLSNTVASTLSTGVGAFSTI
jgi:hypothetical protein